MKERNMEEINKEIEEELLRYQNSSQEDTKKTSNFSWGKAIVYIIIISLFAFNVIKHIFF
ncbi:hypothetical protein HIR68_06670 [Staphylococcus coagulans]|uniref:hypothetical protein n=1 Tax=Staphylococcus coagulans TaxID=74706 RepID=UPI001BE5528C|nr:hypothetical protein [Staphylococcus coagulans]MBT2830219.1 hypothetical protein [Staphylococcus coagulans]MBT2860050.1 hypothetical protein [Staphylococcus coagulans]MBU3873326.1 hypothetical protein [Staphylococcus coagulans]UNB48820.1 hypothetical protein KM149_01415 [Staphylococcus coagulans]